MKKIYFITTLSLICSSTNWAANVTLGANGLPETQACTHKEVLWYQRAAERIAMNREIFLSAEQTIKQEVAAQKLKPQHWGVILDIDETLLNNSEWNYQHHFNHTTQTWDQFAAQEKSTAIPGAIEFTHHIHQMGGYVSLVSNRTTELQAPTEQNLKSQHIYFDQILLDTSKKGTSFVDKNARFIDIAKGLSPSKLPPQNIIAWLGDNIQDFPNLKQHDFINKTNNSTYELFGKTYFILPNPMYGSWEANN